MESVNVKHNKEEKKVPNLRFPGFEGKWMGKQFGEQTKIYDGTHATPDYTETGVPFYSVEHVTANQFNDTKFIAHEVWEKENNRVKLERDDILMTRIGDIGTPRIIDWDVEASFYVSLALIKSSEHFNSFFVSQYIQTVEFQRELWKRTIHVAFPRKINLGEIGNCNLNLPSLPEQQKIASFLSAVDQKIQQLIRNKELLELYKKGVMQKIFPPVGGQALEIRFRDVNGNDYPDWEEKRLGEVVLEHNSGIYKKKELYGEGNNIIGVSDLYSINAIDGQEFNRVPLTNEEFQKYSLREGDLLYGESSLVREGIAKTLYVTEKGAKTCFAWHTRRFSVQLRIVNPAYLYYHLNSFYERKKVMSVATQTALTGITTTDYLGIKIVLPKKEEQKKLADFLVMIDNKIKYISNQIYQTQKFKKGLLQQMFV